MIKRTRKPRIIGLCGRKRSGKDTVCEIIQQAFPGSVRIAFADALKEEMAKALGHTVEFINDNKDTFRLGLQWFGTEYRRKLFGDDYWIQRARDKFNQAYFGNPPVIVFTDARFPNEADLTWDLGGKLWRIRRFAVDSVVDGHASEHALDYVQADLTLHNDGTVEDLRTTVLHRLKWEFGLRPEAEVLP